MTQTPLDDFIEFVDTKHGEESWITIFRKISVDNGSEDGAFFCALVDQERTGRAMKHHAWDISIGTGLPGFSTSYSQGNPIHTYLTQSDDGFRYLVMWRDFRGVREGYLEINEEFRLFHNLYYDQKTSSYFSFDEDGEEIEVINVRLDEVKVRKSFVRSFMAATQTNLLLYFEVTRHFNSNIDYRKEVKSSSIVLSLYSGQSYSAGFSFFTRVLGKKLIRCGAVEQCGVPPFERPTTYEDFIIGGDIDSPSLYNCSPDGLADYFGGNKNAPQYLTPVFFKKAVMSKYYSSSDFEVGDGYLSKKGFWYLRLDNDAPDHIAVFLGDLGRDLPSTEQTYWKSFNVVPDGRNISLTNHMRSFQGKFTDPKNPEHRFKAGFREMQEAFLKKFGWPLFLPLSKKDQHFFSSLRSMLSNDQSEFDQLILASAKITIDSVNVKELKKLLSENEESRSIALLEKFFQNIGIKEFADYCEFLRGVQAVRSSGVAHRKGTEYEKVMVKLKIDEANYSAAFGAILSKFELFFAAIGENIN